MDEALELAKRRLGSVVGGKWTLKRVLGAGGVGAVYGATSPNGEAAAIKVLHAELAHKSDVKERFLREGTLANNIGHEGALRVLDQGTTPDGTGFLVMELLEGETISELLRKDGPIGVKELFGYLDQVLDVLVRAHDVGIIHRDLKPDNLFLTLSGQLKVLDFGLARRLADITGSFKTKTGLALGTLPYMAPEQALGRRTQVDGRVDLFALGAMAFRVLARRKIHEAESEAELLMKMASAPAPPLARFAPNLPPGVHQVVDMALAFSRDARYPDARTMQQDVKDVLSGSRPRYATHQHEQRANQTRLATTVPPQPSSRRVAHTEPLDTRAAAPPADSGGPVVVPTASLGPLPPAPASQAYAVAAGVNTTAPFSHAPGFAPAAGPTAPAFPPAFAPGFALGAPVVAASPRSKAPLVLVSVLVLCVLAAGGLAVALHEDDAELATPRTEAPPALQENPRAPTVAAPAAPGEPARTELVGSAPADVQLNTTPSDAALKSTAVADEASATRAAKGATGDPDASATPEPDAPEQARSEPPGQANRAAEPRAKSTAPARPATPRLARPRN